MTDRNMNWVRLEKTSRSGKLLFICSACGRETPTPDKSCEGVQPIWDERPGAKEITLSCGRKMLAANGMAGNHPFSILPHSYWIEARRMELATAINKFRKEFPWDDVHPSLDQWTNELHFVEQLSWHYREAEALIDATFLKTFLDKQIAWSEKTFGPGMRTKGIIEHIKTELKEIEANPNDLIEWVDVMILAFDGAWRAGFTSFDIIRALSQKQRVNFEREWPKPVSEDEPSFHIKEK